MRLTQFSDYALRTLLYLGVHDDRLVPVAEVARSYRISHHHLVKVTATLTELGLVEGVRGRGGGLRLAVDPGEINVGWIIRRTEPDLHLVECFDRETDTCPITPACMLKKVLYEARKSFLDTLDRYSLADFLESRERKAELVRLWNLAGAEVEVG
jgi:Rrf2 family transcriptional regulator, nitric oxide-sensitive transcriptional repressor